jgi:hypothetical protein
VEAGAVIRQAFELYAAHARHLVSVAFVVYLAITALTIALAFVIGVFVAFVTLAGVFWLQGVLVKAVEDVRDGRADLSVRATLESALPRITVLSASGFLAVVAVLAATSLFIVPGLALLTFWSLIVPAIVLENAGVLRAFRRSAQLVRGHAWSVFTVILVTLLLLVVAGLLLALAVSPVDSEWARPLLVGVVANSVFAPYVAVAWTLMYFRLRALEEPPA